MHDIILAFFSVCVPIYYLSLYCMSADSIWHHKVMVKINVDIILYPNIQLGGVAMPHSRCEGACNLGMTIKIISHRHKG